MKNLMPLQVLTGALVVGLGLSLPADVSKYSEWLEVSNLGPAVNTPNVSPRGEENTPLLSRDGLALYFVANRSEGYGDLDLYVTRRESRTAEWEVPQNLGPNVNSADREYWPTLSPDGHRLYFSILRAGAFDLYVSHRRDKKDDIGWEPAVPVADLNTPYFDVALVFFEDDESGDLIGYFASTRPTHDGDVVFDANIFETRLQEDGTFAPPTLVPGLNTDDYEERLPTVRRDGLEVFFSHAVVGDMGMGKIFSARRESQADAWSEAVQVPYPVNYGGDRSDGAARLSFDGTELYYASSRRNLFQKPFLDINVAVRSRVEGR